MDNIWENEPDQKEWVCEGYRCEMIRHARLKHWCGYVDVPKGHPLFGKTYSAEIIPPKHILERPVSVEKIGAISLLCAGIGEDGSIDLGLCFDVYGGLTYSREEGQFWRFGFDCAHAGDLTPGRYRDSDDVYRDEAFVTAETESLARQLKASEHWWDHAA